MGTSRRESLTSLGMNPSEFRIRRGFTAVVLALSVGVIGAACGSEDSSGGSSAASHETPAGETSAAGDAPAAPIDACALLPTDEIALLLAAEVEGTPTGTDPDMPGCIWENPLTYESVSVEIGSPDTAVDGALPPIADGSTDTTRPGPDGMRFLGSGSVGFAAGNRSNTVQVAVFNMMGPEADDTAVDLARQISAQLNG